MTIVLAILKVIASIILVGFLVAGIIKANPRTHNLSYGHLAEYSTGFLLFIGSIIGIYFLWR